MKDEKKQLLMNMFTDIGEDIICELAVAIEKIEAGTLPSYGLALNAYAFHVNADRISIEEFAYGPGSEYATNSFDELKELLDLYCGLYYKIYGIDLKVIDENYWPLVEGIIDDYPAKEEVRKQLRFPDE